MSPDSGRASTGTEKMKVGGNEVIGERPPVHALYKISPQSVDNLMKELRFDRVGPGRQQIWVPGAVWAWRLGCKTALLGIPLETQAQDRPRWA